jgi:hypothetical protein
MRASNPPGVQGDGEGGLVLAVGPAVVKADLRCRVFVACDDYLQRAVRVGAGHRGILGVICPFRAGPAATIACCSRSPARVHVAHQPAELGMQPAEDLVRADGLKRETMGLAQQVQQRDRLCAGEVYRRGLRGDGSDVHQLIVRQYR